MDTRPPSAFLSELSKVNRKLRTMFDARVKQEGLTLTRARLLLHLSREEGITQRELAEILEIEQPSVVTLLDALEKTGFVTREMIKGDRRARSICLTEMARREIVKIQQHGDLLSEQVLADITEADIEVALRVLTQMSRNIAAV